MDHVFNDRIGQEIIEQSPSVAIRLSGNIADWTTEFITKNILQYGYDRKDFQSGQIKWPDLVHPDDLESLRSFVEEYSRLGVDRYSKVYRILTAGGKTVWISHIFTTTRDGEGNALYTDCVVTDHTWITETQAKITDNARRQDVLNDILVSLHNADLDEAMKIILCKTGKYLGLSRGLLFEDGPGRVTARLVDQWRGDGIPSVSEDGAYTLHYEKDMPGLADELRQAGESVAGYGQVPAGNWNTGDIKATAAFAVSLDEKRYGFLRFDECEQERAWTQDTLDFLRTVSNLVSAVVIRRKNEEAVRVSRATMQTVLNNIPTYVLVINPNLRQVVFANETYRSDFIEDTAKTNGVTLHGCIERYCRQCPELTSADKPASPRYFEVELTPAKMCVAVRCSGVPWVNGKRMCLLSGQDITERKRQEEYIQRIAYLDHLTGLPNRHRCDGDVTDAIQSARAENNKGYLIFMDLDDFKIVNDGYGHDYGDALLIEFASYLRRMCIPGNQVFRYGGDEFVLLVVPENAGVVQGILDELMERVLKPWPALDKAFHCTLSIGVVGFPDGGMGMKEILRNADIAMYESKKQGKNKCTFYSDNLRTDSMERARVEAMLRQSIANGFEGFMPYYQPFVDIKTGRVTGAEALIRWRGPDERLTMPISFIALSEYLGVIVPIGMFILRDACALLRQINETVDPEFMISVNISMRQAQQQDFLRQIEIIFDETGANPRNLMLEVTEALKLSEIQRIQIVLSEMHKKGVKIAIDDFGTSHSSLNNIRDTRIDIVKIDGSFIQNIAKDGYADSFIKLITEFSHSVDKHVCIEGVETETQLDYAKNAGADLVQGFYFHRPVEKERLLGMIAK